MSSNVNKENLLLSDIRSGSLARHPRKGNKAKCNIKVTAMLAPTAV